MTFSVFVVYSSDYDDIVLFSRTMRWWGCGWETSGLRSTVFCLYRPATTCLPSPTWPLRYSSTYSPHYTPFNIPNPFPIQLPPHQIISKWHPRYSSTSPLRSTFPPPLISHPIQHPLLHPSPTPTPPNYLKNYTSGTILLSNPHPTPWWLAHHLLHDAIGNIQHSRLHPTACNYCIIWHVSHWLHVPVLTSTGICNVLIVWFDKPMLSSCISLSVWPLKNVRVNCFDCGIWSVLGEC